MEVSSRWTATLGWGSMEFLADFTQSNAYGVEPARPRRWVKYSKLSHMDQENGDLDPEHEEHGE